MIPTKTRTTPTVYQADASIELYLQDCWNEFLYDENGIDVYIYISNGHYTKLIQSEDEFYQKL